MLLTKKKECTCTSLRPPCKPRYHDERAYWAEKGTIQVGPKTRLLSSDFLTLTRPLCPLSQPPIQMIHFHLPNSNLYFIDFLELALTCFTYFVGETQISLVRRGVNATKSTSKGLKYSLRSIVRRTERVLRSETVVQNAARRIHPFLRAHEFFWGFAASPIRIRTPLFLAIWRDEGWRTLLSMNPWSKFIHLTIYCILFNL